LQQVLASITEFIGHLHPVLVHLPIGILLLACLFLWQSRKDKYENLQRPINITLFWGMVSAVASCLTGWILSQNGDYEETLVEWHRWMGISVAIVSIATYFFRKKKSLRKWQWMLASLLLFLIFVTGHLGGSLTHGTDYLSAPLKNMVGDGEEAVVKRKPIPNIEEAWVYADIIQPVLQQKCYGCHGASKQKGKLRLDQPDMILKGGKDGLVLRPGHSAESELIKRVLLPREDEHHMAPKEKPQLETRQISLLRWWIDNGADFGKKVKDLPQPDSIKPLLLSLQNADTQKTMNTGIPPTPVEAAAPGAIDTLKRLGILVLPVAQNSHYLEVNYITANASSINSLSLLLPLKNQLVWLRLSGAPVDDSALYFIGQCIQLRKLQLDHTHISDKGMQYLRKLEALEYLNLTDTRITADGLSGLQGLKKLQTVYLYHTNIDRKDWLRLEREFPKVRLDSGGYTVPFLKTDTMIVKPPPLPH
jgi:uncharacterized membrane protein